MLWLALIGLMLAAPANSQTIVIATTGTFPPYLIEETTPMEGFDIDLMEAICQRNGFTCEYRLFPLLPGLQAVANGEADVALGGLGITAEREVYGNFTCPYRGRSGGVSPVFALSADVSLQDARIAVLANSLTHDDVVEQGLTAVPFDSLQAAIGSVLSGETDAFSGNTSALATVDNASERLLRIGSIQGQASQGAGFLVSSANPRLLAVLNESIAGYYADGTLRRLNEMWFGRYSGSPDQALACASAVAMR